MHIERERRWLVRGWYPGIMPDYEAVVITQNYLLSFNENVYRVRLVDYGVTKKYLYTSKRKVSADSAEENEWELSQQLYEEALQSADPTREPIKKTRFIVKDFDLTWELDMFWDNDGLMILELENPPEGVEPPPWVSVIREITGEPEYSNYNLALRDRECRVPPPGWRCTRMPGHDGPCAALPR